MRAKGVTLPRSGMWQRTAAYAAVAALLLGAPGGCTSKPETLHDRLEMTAPDQFRYLVTATMLHPLESRQAEKTRMILLGKRLEERGLCPHGYEILSRDVPTALIRDSRYEYTVQDITYVGRCKS